MALYLGNSRVAPTNAFERLCKTGTVTSDDYGLIFLPKINFEPKLIAIWNISKIDQWANLDEGETEEDYEVRYLYDGIMLFSVNQNGTWFSQYTRGGSGELRIQSSSAGQILEDVPVVEEYESGVYIYRLNGAVFTQGHEQDEDTVYDISNVEFNYAIYG